jgi:hypothetical protein
MKLTPQTMSLITSGIHALRAYLSGVERSMQEIGLLQKRNSFFDVRIEKADPYTFEAMVEM